VPVGVLLDRFGSRRMLVTGALLMAAGQLAFALVPDVRLAIGARVLIGVGDSMTFMSVLRVVALWFPPRRNPLFVQLTGVLGQLGSVASAVPLVVLLRDAGWAATYLAAAGLGLIAAVLVAAALKDHPGVPATEATRRRGTLRAAWSEPGTRLGLWTHFTTQFSGFVFGLLWGFPFLVEGEGLDPSTAAVLLSLLTVALLVGGPVVGHLCGRLPYCRSVLVLVIVGGSAAAWGAVLLWPGRAPLWLLVLLVVVLGTNGPGSMIGFDFARTWNPVERQGSASGVVNVGGFVASLLTILAVGAVLDLLTPGGSTAYSLGAFRAAFSVQYVFWAIGLVGVVRHRRQLRDRLARDGVVLAPLYLAVGARLRGGSAYR
jgi:MFS family permease